MIILKENRTFSGFTLVEMAIVLAVVALLLGGLLPTISSQMEQAQRKETRSSLSEIQQALLIPTEIAKRVGLKSARSVNLKLTEFSLQTNHRDHKNHLYYELTKEGLCILSLLLTNINKPSQSLIRNLKFNDFLDIR